MTDSGYKKNYPHIIGVSGKTGAGKSTLSAMLANYLKATLISWDDYDEISTEPDDFITWYQNGKDYKVFKRKALSNNLKNLKNNKKTLHAVFNKIIPITQFIIFDAPLGRLHHETGRFIDTMVHVELPLDVLLCRRLFRDFNNKRSKKDLLTEIKFYIEHSRPLYFDKELKDTADLVVNGMLSPDQELTYVIGHLNKNY